MLFGSMLISALPVRAHEPVVEVKAVSQTTFFAGLWASVQSFFNDSSTTTKIGIGAGIAALAGIGYWYWKKGAQRVETPKKDKDADYKELCAAVRQGNTNAIVRLINESEDLYMNGAYADGKTILMLVIEQWQQNAQATMNNFNINTFKQILDAVVGKIQQSPTSLAKYMCLFASKDNNGDTIFHYAARTKSDEFMQHIILAIPKHGASAVENIDKYLIGAKNNKGESALDLCGAETKNSLRTFLPNNGYSLTFPVQERDDIKRPEEEKKDDREENPFALDGIDIRPLFSEFEQQLAQSVDGNDMRNLFHEDEHDSALSRSMMEETPSPAGSSDPDTPTSMQPASSPEPTTSNSSSPASQDGLPTLEDEEEADNTDIASPNPVTHSSLPAWNGTSVTGASNPADRVSRLLGHVSSRPAVSSSSSSTAAKPQKASERKPDANEDVDRRDKGAVDQTRDLHQEAVFKEVIADYIKNRDGHIASAATDAIGVSNPIERKMAAISNLKARMAELGIQADSWSNTGKQFFVFAVETGDYMLVEELLMRGQYLQKGMVSVPRSQASKTSMIIGDAYNLYASKWIQEPQDSDKYKIYDLFNKNWKR